MLKAELEKIVKDQEAYLDTTANIIERELSQKINWQYPKATIVSGVRRAGKSTLLRQVYHQNLMSVGYLHFDDPRLHEFRVDDFYTLEQIFQDKEIYQFDEIQKVNRWEEYVRQAVERTKKIGITGSNAQLLSKELGTLLTGRHITHELFPFSYREFLTYRQHPASLPSFDQYFKVGGLPEAIAYEIPGYHNQLLEDIIYRDISVRFNIKNTHDLTNVVLHTMNNPGRPFSYSSLAKAYSVKSVKSISDYISMLEDTYLVFQVPIFSYSYKKQQNNAKKAYIIDHAFARANSTHLHEDKGRYLENMVFIHERMHHKKIWYFSQNNECDFVVDTSEGHHKLIQVCWEITNDNKDREFAGISEAMHFLKIDLGTIITYNQEDTVKLDGKHLQLIPFYKYYGT